MTKATFATTVLSVFLIRIGILECFVPTSNFPRKFGTKSQRVRMAEEVPDPQKSRNAKIEALEATMAEQKAVLTELGAEIENLSKRINGIVGAFEPATLYASMETAVYEFVTPPAWWNETEEEKFKFRVSQTASQVLQVLTSTEPLTQKLDIWKIEKKSIFSEKEASEIGCSAIGALVAFVQAKNIEKKHLLDWPPEQSIVKNSGNFLKVLHDSENLDRNDAVWTETEVKEMQDWFKYESQVCEYYDIEEAVIALLVALGNKDINPRKDELEEALRCIKTSFSFTCHLNSTAILEESGQCLH